MRKIDSISAMLLLLCAATSCSQALDDDTSVGGEAVEPLFSVGTRINPADGTPTHGDTYTLISYGLNASTITSAQQWGYYAYDAQGMYSENLVPIEIADRYPYGPRYTPLRKDRSYAQMLNSIPVSGTNPNSQGIYCTAIIYPAIPVQNAMSNGLGLLPVFGMDDNVWASSPDDADGDGNPFKITVTSNGQVHEVPDDVKLYPVKAGLRVYFYSHYYVGMQEMKQEFSIKSIDLVNSGSNGWFNARTGVVYPNYNYKTNKLTVHSLTVAVTAAGDNYRDLLPAAANDDLIPDGAGAQAQWLCDNIRVFPSDYSGNSPYVLPMSLAIVLEMKTGGVNRVNIPVSFVIERGKQYTFYVNVTSELVNISYNVSNWNPVTENYDNIGGPVMDYAVITLSKITGGWDNGAGGNESIGN